MLFATRRPRLAPLLAGAGVCLLAACAPSTPSAAPAPAAAPSTVVRERPTPYPMEESPGFRRAVTAGTRTRTGVPGAKYWQQWSKYTLAATYDPATGRLTGTGTIRYYNRSPRQLTTVYVHLHDNLFGDSAVRNETVPITGGVTAVARRGPRHRDPAGPAARRAATGSTAPSCRCR